MENDYKNPLQRLMDNPWLLLALGLLIPILSYTVWLGPFGGHEMGLTHYLGGRRAARQRIHGGTAFAQQGGLTVRFVGMMGFALATHPAVLYGAWIVIGLAMAATLYETAMAVPP